MKVGDTVMLKKGRSRASAYIEAFLNEIQGGLVLDRKLDGFSCWNVKDLKLSTVKPRTLKTQP